MNSINIALNTLRRLSKEKSMLLYLIVFPILAGILVVTITGKTNTIEIGLVREAASEDLADYLSTTEVYSVSVIERSQVEALIKDKTIAFAIDLREGSLTRPEDKPFIVYSYDRDTAKIYELETILSNYINKMPVAPPVQGLDKEGEPTADRMALGFLTMFILMFISSVTSTILEDRRGKTLMRTFSGPVKALDFAFGHLVANIIIGATQILIFLMITKHVVMVDWQLPLFKIFVLMLVYLITAIGLCIGLTGITKNQEKYSVVNTLVTVATCLLGGSFFPTKLMPRLFQNIALLTPQNWAMETYEKLSAAGALQDVQLNFAILLLYGLVLFSFGVTVLKPSEEDL